MKALLLLALLMALGCKSFAQEQARVVTPDYGPPKVVFELYLEDPAMVGTALSWVRGLVNPLLESPYNMAPESMDIKIVSHGTEIAALVKRNYEKFTDAVDRMRYYASLGVEFKVCGLAAHDYGYSAEDFYEFVEIVPSAFTELTHWQQQGYALISPRVLLRHKSMEELK